MKTLVVYPAISLAGFGQKEKSGSGEVQWISHGVGFVVTCARKAGFDVSFVDLRDLSGWLEFETRLQELMPDVVGMSVSYLDYKPAMKAIELAKGINPKVKVVVGGILPSNFPDMFLNNQIDYVLTGEGEISFVELLQAIESGGSFGRLTRGKVPDLDALPFVEREMFDYQGELDSRFCPGQVAPVVTMIAGRGCPFHCNYCQPSERAVFSGKFRIRSPENIIAELSLLRDRYGFNSITWWDDTFTVDPKWVHRFCDLYQAEGFTASMVACSRADIICNNEAMVARLAEVGLSHFVIGVESGSQRLLDFIEKGTTVEQNIEAARICRRHGVHIYATAMLGLPTETKEEAASTIAMLRKIAPDVVSLFYFNPIPGTGIYEFCKTNDLILKADEFDISRTEDYRPKIRGIEYRYLDQLRKANVVGCFLTQPDASQLVVGLEKIVARRRGVDPWQSRLDLPRVSTG